jgi:hypothetical protein
MNLTIEVEGVNLDLKTCMVRLTERTVTRDGKIKGEA